MLSLRPLLPLPLASVSFCLAGSSAPLPASWFSVSLLLLLLLLLLLGAAGELLLLLLLSAGAAAGAALLPLLGLVSLRPKGL
jgi:hypothetical protein